MSKSKKTSADCVGVDDMISLKPIKLEHAIVIKKQCYDVRQLKKWMDGKEKAGKAPTVPHTNLPITAKDMKKIADKLAELTAAPVAAKLAFHSRDYDPYGKAWMFSFVDTKLASVASLMHYSGPRLRCVYVQSKAAAGGFELKSCKFSPTNSVMGEVELVKELSPLMKKTQLGFASAPSEAIAAMVFKATGASVVKMEGGGLRRPRR